MSGSSEWKIVLSSNVDSLLSEIKSVDAALDALASSQHKINVSIDFSKLKSELSQVESMIKNIGNGTSSSNQFKVLSYQMKSITKDMRTLSSSFGQINMSNGLTGLLSSLDRIDAAMASLHEHMTGYSVDYSKYGHGLATNTTAISSMQQEAQAVKQVSEAYDGLSQKRQSASRYLFSTSQINARNASNNFYNKETRRINSDGYIASDAYKNAYANLKSANDKVTGITKNAEANKLKLTTSEIEEYKKAMATVKKYEGEVKGLSSTEKGLTKIQQSKVKTMLAELNGYTAMSSANKAQLEQYNEIASANKYYNFTDMTANLKSFKAELVETGQARKSFIDTFKEKSFYTGAQKLASMFTIWDGIRYAKQIASVSTEINTAFVELSKVSGYSLDNLESKLSSFASTAKDVGATMSDTISATADWSRMGYSLSDSQELAEVSLIYKNVGDGIDIDDANNSLISTLKGYNLEASDAMSVIDKFNEVSNNFAIDSGGIGEALQRSAASFNAANTDLSKSIALITGTNTTVQDPDKVGCNNIADLYSNVMKKKWLYRSISRGGQDRAKTHIPLTHQLGRMRFIINNTNIRKLKESQKIKQNTHLLKSHKLMPNHLAMR